MVLEIVFPSHQAMHNAAFFGRGRGGNHGQSSRGGYKGNNFNPNHHSQRNNQTSNQTQSHFKQTFAHAPSQNYNKFLK